MPRSRGARVGESALFEEVALAPRREHPFWGPASRVGGRTIYAKKGNGAWARAPFWLGPLRGPGSEGNVQYHKRIRHGTFFFQELVAADLQSLLGPAAEAGAAVPRLEACGAALQGGEPRPGVVADGWAAPGGAVGALHAAGGGAVAGTTGGAMPSAGR